MVELNARPVVLSPGYLHFIREQATRNRDKPERRRRHDDCVDQSGDSKIGTLQDVERDRERQRQVLHTDFERDRDDLWHGESEHLRNSVTETHCHQGHYDNKRTCSREVLE